MLPPTDITPNHALAFGRRRRRIRHPRTPDVDRTTLIQYLSSMPNLRLQIPHPGNGGIRFHFGHPNSYIYLHPIGKPVGGHHLDSIAGYLGLLPKTLYKAVKQFDPMDRRNYTNLHYYA